MKNISKVMQLIVRSKMRINRRVGPISIFLETLTFTSRIKMNFTIQDGATYLVKGNFLKEGGKRYAAADVIALANNGVMHLFSKVKYVVGHPKHRMEC